MKTFLQDILQKIQGYANYMKETVQVVKHRPQTDQTEDLALPSEESTHVLSGAIDYRKFWLIGILVIGIGWFSFQIIDRILLVFTGVIIAIAIESLITYFEQKTGRRWLAILLAYLILIGLLLSGVLVMIPFLVNQIGDIIGVVINQARAIESTLKTVGLWEIVQQTRFYDYLKTFGVDLAEPRYLEQLQSIIQNNISAIITFSSGYAKDAGGIVVSTVWGLLSALAQVGFVLTLSVLLSIEKTAFMRFIYRLSGHSATARRKINTLYVKLGFWLRTQILLGIYIGITMYVGLWILSLFGIDVPNKWSLAVISALTELIPYLWPTLGWIPVIIMGAVSNGRIGVIITGALVFAVQRLENNILIPLLFKQSLGVSPVVIFLCMVLLWITIGLNGVIIAIPIAVIITILFDKDA